MGNIFLGRDCCKNFRLHHGSYLIHCSATLLACFVFAYALHFILPPVIGIAALLQPDKTKSAYAKTGRCFASTRFLNFYLAIPESLPVSAGAPSFGSVPAKLDSKISEAFSKEAKAVRKQTRCPRQWAVRLFELKVIMVKLRLASQQGFRRSRTWVIFLGRDCCKNFRLHHVSYLIYCF